MKKLVFLLVPVLLVAALAGIYFFKKLGIQGQDKSTVWVPQYTVDETKKVVLPTEYPKQIVPLMAKAELNAASVREDKQKKKKYYSVSLSLDRSVTEVVQFYQKATQGHQDVKTIKNQGFFSIVGTYQDKKYSINIQSCELNGKKKTLVFVLIQPAK